MIIFQSKHIKITRINVLKDRNFGVNRKQRSNYLLHTGNILQRHNLVRIKMQKKITGNTSQKKSLMTILLPEKVDATTENITSNTIITNVQIQEDIRIPNVYTCTHQASRDMKQKSKSTNLNWLTQSIPCLKGTVEQPPQVHMKHLPRKIVF